jgi:uncharacterized protein YfaS (alpha-2-macroglobulin family)
VAVVETDADRAWVDLRTHALAHAPKDVEGAAPVDGLEAYAYVDRGVVRPGETAHLGVVVRTPEGAAPPADPVIVHAAPPVSTQYQPVSRCSSCGKTCTIRLMSVAHRLPETPHVRE